MKRFLFKLVLSAAKAMPGTASVIDGEQQKIIAGMKEDFIGHTFDDEHVNNELPAHGMSTDDVVSTLTRFRGKEAPKYETRKISGGIYHGGHELTELITKAYGMYVPRVACLVSLVGWCCLRMLSHCTRRAGSALPTRCTRTCSRLCARWKLRSSR